MAVNRIEVKVTEETKNILDIYDTEQLLKTVPQDYQVSVQAVKIYLKSVKPMPSPVLVTLSDETLNRLNSMAQNCNAELDIIFNFLIETVCNCGKIQTKKVARALDNYYNLMIKASTKNDEKAQQLFSKVLDEYSASGFYDDDIGLSEESMAMFLTVSNEGRELVDEMERLN